MRAFALTTSEQQKKIVAAVQHELDIAQTRAEQDPEVSVSVETAHQIVAGVQGLTVAEVRRVWADRDAVLAAAC